MRRFTIQTAIPFAVSAPATTWPFGWKPLSAFTQLRTRGIVQVRIHQKLTGEGWVAQLIQERIGLLIVAEHPMKPVTPLGVSYSPALQALCKSLSSCS
jgi:DNA polymerase III psi subunit